MDFNLYYFFGLLLTNLAFWWVAIKWANMNTRQTVVLLVFTILVVLAAEWKVQRALEEMATACAEMIFELTDEDVSNR